MKHQAVLYLAGLHAVSCTTLAVLAVLVWPNPSDLLASCSWVMACLLTVTNYPAW
jgi:hypothetical protein